MIQYNQILQARDVVFVKINDFQELTKLNWNYSEDAHRRMLEVLNEMGIDPGNFYQELEMSSPYVNTHRDISYYNSPVNLHSHSYIEIIYCRTSSDVEYLIGSDRYRMQRGDIVFIPAGISHRPIMPEKMSVPYERDVLWISNEFMEQIRNMFPADTVYQAGYIMPVRTAGTRWEYLGDLFRAGVLEEEEKRPGWDVAVIGNTVTILAHLKRAYLERTTGAMRAEKPELLDRITAYIETHYAEHITIEDLAKQFYVSKSSVSHLFKQKMGVSIYRYVTQRRLIEAKKLLQKGYIMEDVSRIIGFSDYSTFYRAFKQEYGISPRQFAQL